MWTRSRLLLAVLVAALGLAFAVGTATAGRFRLSSTSFSVRWREFHVPTGITAEEPQERIRHCPLTLSGSFHSATTIRKVPSSLVGLVNAATMGTCTGEGGRVVLLGTGLPWHLTYKEFSGALPAISRLRLGLLGFRMSIEVPPLFGVVCLITSTAAEPLNIDLTREAGGGISSAGGTESLIAARDTTGFGCEGLRWMMGGTGSLDNGSGARITVTLI